jgi:glutathione S-transferase
LNSALNGKQWLVGNQVSIADISVAVSLVVPLQIILDGGFRKAMKSVIEWAERVFAIP